MGQLIAQPPTITFMRLSRTAMRSNEVVSRSRGFALDDMRVLTERSISSMLLSAEITFAHNEICLLCKPRLRLH
jgi:hypothetical protein